MSKTSLILACLLLTASTLVACSRDGAPANDGTTVIYRGNGGDPGSLDPALAEDIHAFNILADLYEGLVTLSADGLFIPGVAESWSISPDGLTYTFTIREDALWSDGQRVTAEHFVQAYERVTAPASTSAYSFLFDPVRDYVAIDASTLRIHLAEQAPQLLAVLSMAIAFPIPAIDSDPGAFVDPQKFIGNGAYVLVSHRIGEETRLRRNPNYRDASDVAIDEIVYLPIVDPMSELNRFRAGEIDVTNTIPPASMTALRESMPDAVRIAPSLALYYLAFDLTEPPLDDALLRQALSMAIDRQQLVELIGRGEQPAYGIVPNGIAGYEGPEFEWRDLSDEERIRQARELYQQAGYDATNPLALKYTYDAGDIHEKVALAVTSMWRDALGVDASLEKKEWQYFLDTRDRRDDWQVMRFAWFGDYNHASTFTNIFRSTDEQNLAHYESPEYDHLLSAANREQQTDRQAELIAEAEALLIAEHPVAPLYFFVSKHLVAPRIGGFEHNALDRHPSRFLYLEADD